MAASKNAIERFIHGYGETQKREMTDIQNAFTQNCYPIEKDLSPTTLEKLPDKDEKALLPKYFVMDKHFSLPFMYIHNLKPDKTLSNWCAKLQKKSLLFTHIQEILAYICENQNARDQGIGNSGFIKEGYNYDPTNSFYEEFKYWLVELSKQTILNEDLLKVVEGRIKYLKYMDVKTVFHPRDDRDFPRIARIKVIVMVLENHIKRLIMYSISRNSSREHFRDLKIVTTNFLYDAVKFIFYFSKNNSTTPKNFILAEIRKPTLESYKKIEETTSEKLLQHLTQTEVFLSIFPPTSEDNQLIHQESIFSNSFMTAKGGLALPSILSSLSIHDWYLDKEVSGLAVKSGIIGVFRQEQLMNSYILLHGQLQQFCLFTLICDMLFELAGDGGDLLVYGYAASKVERVISSYQHLRDGILANFSLLSKAASNYKDEIDVKKIKKSKKNKYWYENYHFISDAYQKITDSIGACNELIKNIKDKMSDVKSPQYSALIKRKLDFFSQCVEHFSPELRGAPKKSLIATTVPNTALLANNPFALVSQLGSNGEEPIIKEPVNAPKNGSLISKIITSKEEQTEDKIGVKQNQDYTEDQLNQLFNEAHDCYDTGNYDTAIKLFKKVIRFDSREDALADSWFLLGLAYGKLGNISEALTSVDQAKELNKKDSGILLAKARLLFNFKLYNEALSEVDDLLNKFPNNSQAEALKIEIELKQKASITDISSLSMK